MLKKLFKTFYSQTVTSDLPQNKKEKVHRCT